MPLRRGTTEPDLLQEIVTIASESPQGRGIETSALLAAAESAEARAAGLRRLVVPQPRSNSNLRALGFYQTRNGYMLAGPPTLHLGAIDGFRRLEASNPRV